MKGPSIDQLVYESIFPRPKPTDPQNFHNFLQRQLVPEVRLETQAFYGHLASQEAKYPGLDYSYYPHRVRLSRYPWHRRLFRAFDNLRLTNSEIASLTKWEGTRWAKERFELEQGVLIRDTTADGIEDWVEPELRVPRLPLAKETDEDEMEGLQGDGMDENDMEEDGEDSDLEIQSVGIELNERLRARIAEREAGNPATVMDEEWEQWLKDAVEAGGIPYLSAELGLSPNANIPGTRPASDTSAMHPRLLNAARLGQWQQIPEVLRNITLAQSQNLQDNSRPLRLLLESSADHATLRHSTATPLLPRPNHTGPRARQSSSLASSDLRSSSSSTDSGIGMEDSRQALTRQEHAQTLQAYREVRRANLSLPPNSVAGVGPNPPTRTSSLSREAF